MGDVQFPTHDKFFIGGEWREPISQDTFDRIDPASGQKLATLPKANADDVDAAVTSARDAFDNGPWKRLSLGERRKALLAITQLAKDEFKNLAAIESKDVGMPIMIAKRLCAPSLNKNFEYYANWVERMYGEVVPLTGKGHALDYAIREPVGVVAVIIAWNTPLTLLASKVAPALATGNTVVIKPSELAPMSTLKFAEIVEKAGLPPGVVNVITGDGETGSHLVSHTHIDKITFTGGVETGKRIMEAAGRNLTKINLELGGKSPNIITQDADLNKITMGAVMGCFALSGQACAAGTRMFIHEDVYDRFLKQVVNFTSTLKPNDPSNPATLLGPLVAESQVDRVMGYIEKGKQEGAQLKLGGERIGGDFAQGCYVAPTIFGEVNNDMTIAREEIFGPVLSVLRYKTDDEVIEKSNDTEYGLAASVWTTNLKRAHRFASELQAGIVWINTFGQIPATVPFGGYKKSGIGREGGRDGLDQFTQVKNVYIDLN